MNKEMTWTEIFVKLVILLFVYVMESLLLMVVWNAVIPSLFELSSISYWESAGLLVISIILFMPKNIPTNKTN